MQQVEDNIEPVVESKDENENLKHLSISSLDLVGFWEWDLKINECIICKTDLQDPLIDEIEVGKCGHGFHKGCIRQWVQHKNTCPFCNIPWEPNKDFKSNYSINLIHLDSSSNQKQQIRVINENNKTTKQ